MTDLADFHRARIAEEQHVAGRAAAEWRGTGTWPWELWCVVHPARGEAHANRARVLAE